MTSSDLTSAAPTSISYVSAVDGEILRAGPVSHRVLEDGRGVDGRFGVVECHMPAGWSGPPEHVHRAHDETFYVVSGTVRFTCRSEVVLATPGSLVTAAIGVPHTFANAAPDAPASLLVTVTPERYLGYFRELEGLRPGPDGMLIPAEVLELMARYATEPYHPPS